MTKKYRVQHVTIFAVYKRAKMLGNDYRYLKVAFPDRTDAVVWIAEQCHDSTWNKKEDYIIEEMPAIMKTWTPGE